MSGLAPYLAGDERRVLISYLIAPKRLHRRLGVFFANDCDLQFVTLRCGGIALT